MNKNFTIVAVILVICGALAGGLIGRLPSRISANSAVTPQRVQSEFKEAVDLIDQNYVGAVDREKVADSSMQSMLWTLDPHSSFFSREELRKLDEEQASQFYGIGVSILQHRNGVYIQSIVPGTPADKAGLRYGDRILTVEGKDAKDWSSGEVSKNVRGERGTTVKVGIERVGSSQPIYFDIVRGGVPLPSIRNYFMLPGSIGYVGLTGGFQQTTGEELRSAVEDLKKQGMKSLVLDLRGNPGGILEQAVEVVSRFIPKGQTVVSVKGGRGVETRELRSTVSNPENCPLVIMINAGSASASEIVAGAIQDYERGLIVGNDSFGKGLVQRVFRLPYGTGITLTTARYYTPFGRSLQRDYSNGSIYDYYTHGEDSPELADLDVKPKPAGSPVTIPSGKVLYGGRGIEPDLVLTPPKPNPLRARLAEAAFFFARQLVAGKIAGLENYKVEKQNFKISVQPAEFVTSDKLFEAFRAFVVADKEFGLTAENIGSDVEYAKMRIRDEVATANYSNEAGIQVLLEADPQVLKAIEAMPQASELVSNVNLAKRTK